MYSLIKLEESEHLKMYIGFLRSEYNSHFYGSEKYNILDNKTIKNIRLNYKIQKKLGTDFAPEKYTKKSKNFNIKPVRGTSITVTNSKIKVSSGASKKIDFEFTPKEPIPDGVYTNCVIGVYNSVYYININLTKKRTFVKYISENEITRRKIKCLKENKKALVTRLKNTKLKTFLGKYTKKEQEIQNHNSMAQYKLNLVNFLYDLNKEFTISRGLFTESYTRVSHVKPCENQAFFISDVTNLDNNYINKILYNEYYYGLPESERKAFLSIINNH